MRHCRGGFTPPAEQPPREEVVSSLSIFIVGFIILIAGLAYGASLAGMPPQWIAVVAVVLAGIGVVTGVSKTRMKDPSHD
jgi:hypothetical protein